MPSIIIAHGTQARWDSPIVPVVSRGIEAWFTFDTDPARFSINRAAGKSPGTIIGQPAAFDSYGRFTGLINYINTGIAETAEMTILAVCRAVSQPTSANDGVMVVGNNAGNAVTAGWEGKLAYGTNLFTGVANTIQGSACRDNGSGSTTSAGVQLAGDTVTDWAIRVVRAYASSGTVINNLTLGLSATGSNRNTRVLSDSPLLIGSAQNSTLYTGQVDISAVVIHSVALTDDEMAREANQMRVREARLGRTV